MRYEDLIDRTAPSTASTTWPRFAPAAARSACSSTTPSPRSTSTARADARKLPHFPGHKLLFTDSRAAAAARASRARSASCSRAELGGARAPRPQATAPSRRCPAFNVSPPLENERRGAPQARPGFGASSASTRTALQNVSWALRSSSLPTRGRARGAADHRVRRHRTAELSTLRQLEIRSGQSSVPLLDRHAGLRGGTALDLPPQPGDGAARQGRQPGRRAGGLQERPARARRARPAARLLSRARTRSQRQEEMATLMSALGLAGLLVFT